VIGNGGYAYAYDDGAGSTNCMDANAMCTSGTTGAMSSTVWGAGIGVNLNQAQGTATNPNPPVGSLAATGVGIGYSISSLPPQGARIAIDSNGTDYCAVLTGSSGTVPWSAFNTKCWNGSGTSLTGAPSVATHIEFQVPATAAATPFAFCVDSVSFATTTTQPDAGSSSGGGTSCSWTSGPSANGTGELTCYSFHQGTATGGGCPSYKTFCGYCGTESSGPSGGWCEMGATDSVQNIGTGQYFAAFPGGSGDPGSPFGQGNYCGMCVNVTYQGRSILATIVDECSTCSSNGHIDLSLAAAQALGIGVGGTSGDVNGVTWSAASCPVSGYIYAMYNNGGSNQVYFQNVTFPVASARTSGGATGNLTNGFWNFGSNIGGQTVTLTDTLGHTTSGVMPGGSGPITGAQFPDQCH
jgi:hypothetical protein